MGIEVDRTSIPKTSNHSQSLPPLAPHQPFPKPHHTSPRTITLASLVKCKVLSPQKIRETTGGIAKSPQPLSTSTFPKNALFLSPHHPNSKSPPQASPHFPLFIFNLHYLSPLDTSKIIWYYNLNYSFKKNRSFSPFFYTYFNVFADIL